MGAASGEAATALGRNCSTDRDQRQRRFGRWIEGLRAATLRNDDVTLLAVQILE